MLRRGNSKSSNRLGRQKSTLSVSSRRDGIDPDEARRDALSAATYAFARSQERYSADIDGSVGLTRVRDTINNHTGAVEQSEHIVKRQQSVRFAGPTAIRRRRSIGTRALNITIDNQAHVAHRPRALTNDNPVPAAYRPPSRSSSIGKASIGPGTSENYTAALAAYDEYYTHEDDVASTPSSYRRVRKSRSMISSIRPSSVIFNNGTPAQDPRRNLQALLPSHQNRNEHPALRAPKSMSFLRGGRDHLTPRARRDRDVAVQVARDKFLHHVEQQRLREKPSFLFRSKTRKHEKPFRQSLRDRGSSTNSYGLPISSVTQASYGANEGKGSLRQKARKASKSLKNKLKTFFRRGDADVEDALIPVQQDESYKAYGASFTASATTVHASYVDIPHPGEATISRVTSRVPSLHTVPSNQQLKSRTGSLQSLRSQGSGTSRVTSWTSSAVDNTAASRHAQAERERQRLSIIQENGTHVSSASFKRPKLETQFSAYPSFYRPRGSNGAAQHVLSPIDSQKVYTALMQRLEENSPEANLSMRRTASIGSFGPPTPVPPRTSSRNTQRTRTPATIRQINDDEYPDQGILGLQTNPEPVTTWPQEKDDVFSPKSLSGGSRFVKHQRQQIQSTTATSVPKGPVKGIFSEHPVRDLDRQSHITPQLMADRNESLSSQRRGLTESRSTFFGHTGFTINRTTSPYRRALAEADYNPAAITGSTPVRASPIGEIPAVVSSEVKNRSESQGRRKIAYSESIYSRTTSGQTPPFPSTAALNLFQDENTAPGSTGSAVIVDRATYRPTLPTHRPAQSSVDLRAWMSAQVATLEKQKDNKLVTVNYTLPTMPKSTSHHIRERAQISSEDLEISQSNVSQPKQQLGTVHPASHIQLFNVEAENAGRKVSMSRQPLGVIQQNIHSQKFENAPENSHDERSHVKQPLGVVQQNIPQSSHQITLKPILKHKSSVSLVDIPIPLLPPPPPPPLPPKLALRATTSRNSLRSLCTVNSEQSGSAPSSIVKLRKRNPSQAMTGRPTNLIRSDTPGKLVKKDPRKGSCTPSPNLVGVVNKQFGSASSRTPHSLSTESRPPYSTPYGGAENQDPSSNGLPRGVHCGTDGPALTSSELDAQAMGSRRMVDLFLSSRRRRLVGSDESNAFI